MLHSEKTDLNKISQAKDGEGGGRGTEEDEEEIRKGHEIKIRNPRRAITPIEDSVMGSSAGTPLCGKKPVSEWYHKQ